MTVFSIMASHEFYTDSFRTNDIFIILETAAAAAAKSLQSCLTLCDPIDGSPPGTPVPGILQGTTTKAGTLAA